MASQKGWTIDVNQCTGCRGCEAACKTEYNLQIGQGRRRRVIEREETASGGENRAFFTSLACNHCEQPACLKACPVGAYVKLVPNGSATQSWHRDETWMNGTHGVAIGAGGTADIMGVVLHDPSKCIGCRRCEWACPYGAPQFNPENKKMHKCEGCWQRIVNADLHSSRRVPACVATCIGKSISWETVLADGATESLNPQGGIYPAVHDYVAAGTSGSDLVAAPDDGRGSSYLNTYTMTLPAVKVRNRVYQTRTGGWS